MIFFLGAEVVVAMQFFPALLLARASGKWVLPFVPLVRVLLFIIWPVQAVLELLVSVLHLSEEADVQTPADEQQQAIEAFVDAATEEGIIEQDEARLIESVVEFGDKRVRDVMTPRPDVIAIRATLHSKNSANWSWTPSSPASRSTRNRSTISSASSWRATCSKSPTATPRTAPSAN